MIWMILAISFLRNLNIDSLDVNPAVEAGWTASVLWLRDMSVWMKEALQVLATLKTTSTPMVTMGLPERYHQNHIVT